jgi:hypothetical protein
MDGNAADGSTIVNRAVPDSGAGTYTVQFERISGPNTPAVVTAYAICLA